MLKNVFSEFSVSEFLVNEARVASLFRIFVNIRSGTLIQGETSSSYEKRH